MKYFTFLPQFHPLILAGSKRQTIRKSVKLEFCERFALRFWTGKAYRSPMGILGTAICVDVSGVRIESDRFTWFGNQYPAIPDDFAQADGFASGLDMLNHFKAAHGLPFDGFAHRWEDFVPCPEKAALS